MIKFPLTLLLLLMMAPGSHANNYKDYTSRNDKPATVLVAPLIAAINSGDNKKIEAFIRANFESGFMNRYPMAAHVNFMGNIQSQHDTLTYHSIRDYADPLPDTEIVAIVKSANTELWHAITLYVTDQTPYKISGLRFSPARAPSNLPAPPPLTQKQAIEAISDYVKRLADKDVFSGAVLLAKGNKVLYQSAYGLASKRFNVANNVETKFNLGSMNKMFTSIAIMQLVEAEKLSLDDKLSQFVDSSWLAEDVTKDIEIQHLLTHSSGLGNYFNRTYSETSKNAFRTLDDYKPLIENETLMFTPGTDNRYSNTGMFMLGVVIEKVTGQNYFDYIRENIYAPAGMKHTDSYEMDQPVANLAIGYGRDNETETGWRNNLYTHVLKGGPAGGGFSTVGDLHRFAQALTELRFLNKAHTQTLLSAKPELKSPSYGFGFSVRESAQDTIVGHGGGFHGISSNLDIYLKQGYVSAVMSNYDNGSRPVEQKIREMLSRIK